MRTKRGHTKTVLRSALHVSHHRIARLCAIEKRESGGTEKPRTAHVNGEVERGQSHRIDDEEFYQLLDNDAITDDRDRRWRLRNLQL